MEDNPNGTANGDRASQERRAWLDKWWREFLEFLSRHSPPRDSSVGPATMRFTTQQVIAFLQMHRDAGKAAWQRVQMVDAIALHAQLLDEESSPSLASIRRKLVELDIREQALIAADSGIVDENRIDPRNSEVVQSLQIVLRRLHYSKRTECAYTDWVKRFENTIQSGHIPIDGNRQ